MVRDDDRRGAVLHGDLGVLGGDDALEDDRHLRLARDPLEIPPRDRVVEQRELVGGILRRVADRGAGVRERQVGGDLEADPQVALPLREPRRVHREDDGTAAGGRRLGQVLARDARGRGRRTAGTTALSPGAAAAISSCERVQKVETAMPAPTATAARPVAHSPSLS